MTTVSHAEAKRVNGQFSPTQTRAGRGVRHGLDPHIIELIRAASLILEIVAAFVPELRRSGRLYVGACPLGHSSKSKRSFTVDPERASWKCWNCGAGGDVFSFIMEVNHCGFRDAVSILARRAGIDISRPVPEQITARMDARHELAQLQSDIDSIVSAAALKLGRELDDLRRLWRNASARLAALQAGERARWASEAEFAWATLQFVVERGRLVDVAFLIVSFGPAAERERFLATTPESRGAMIAAALELGHVADERGGRHEVGAA